ncbi:hypothetical protein [Longivirga aurantiaca]|uniref:Uncharacterized protein n=1 Tax=Longivirga aurantiaca TaxID=1837743 RepID=A0ABW1SW46_9ACTN
MTRTRHLRRSAALATATALFVLTGTTVAAFAGQDDAVVASTGGPVTAAAVVSPAASLVHSAVAAGLAQTAEQAAADEAAARAAAAKKAAAAKAAAAKAAAAAKKAAAEKKATAARAAASAPKTIYIKGYVNAPGSQAAIDKCQLVLWSSSPLWLAAHNYCGYQWLAFVKTGTTVVVTSGVAQGTYRVYDHMRLGRQSGAMPSTNADLVLQTCVGEGTGLSLLRRV